MSDVSYAVLARAKTKFGKRLKEKDYNNLLDCESVAEVMTYLKTNTHYFNAFGEANEREIHRNVFENLLHQYLNYEFDTISRYDLSVGEYFSNYVANKTEIDAIIRFLILLNSKNKKRFNYTIPAHLEKKTKINLTLLTNATSYKEFQSAIKNTPYEKIIKEFHINTKENLPIAKIENKLYTQLYANLYSSISKTKGSEKEELLELFDSIIDYENFIRILRLKNNYKKDSDYIKSNLLPFGTLKEKQIDLMCEAESSKEIFSAMYKTKYGKLMNNINYTSSNEIIPAVKFKRARHNMYFSDNPTTVMISYIILAEIEVLNLVTIIEGVRYHVDKNIISSLLNY